MELPEGFVARLIGWFASDDTGMSSKQIAAWLAAGVRMPCRDHPYDPSDLGRCLRLLEIIPEWKPRIGEMASVSPAWAALVARWDELAQCMADEVGIDCSKGRRAPETYALMRSILRLTEGQQP